MKNFKNNKKIDIFLLFYDIMNCTELLPKINQLYSDDPLRSEIIRNCIDDGPTLILMFIAFFIMFICNLFVPNNF